MHVANGITSGPNQRFATDPSAEIYAVGSPSGRSASRESSIPAWLVCRLGGNPEIFEIDADRLGPIPTPTTSRPARPTPPPASWPTSTTAGTLADRLQLHAADDAAPGPRPQRRRVHGRHTTTCSSSTAASDHCDRLPKHSGYIRIVLGAPDVLGVEECLSITELNALAARIHTDDATLTYTAYLFEGHDIGGIDVGFLVRYTVTTPSSPSSARTSSSRWTAPSFTTGRRSSSRRTTSVTARRSRSR